MKLLAVFDDCYDTSDELEKEVNEWIEQYGIDVISIDVKTYISAFSDNVCLNGDEETVNAVYWYATVVYEEK